MQPRREGRTRLSPSRQGHPTQGSTAKSRFSNAHGARRAALRTHGQHAEAGLQDTAPPRFSCAPVPESVSRHHPSKVGSNELRGSGGDSVHTAPRQPSAPGPSLRSMLSVDGATPHEAQGTLRQEQKGSVWPFLQLSPRSLAGGQGVLGRVPREPPGKQKGCSSHRTSLLPAGLCRAYLSQKCGAPGDRRGPQRGSGVKLPGPLLFSQGTPPTASRGTRRAGETTG